MTVKFKNCDFSNLIKMYQSGMSCNQLSNLSGIPRITLNRHFSKHGVVLRSQSDSEKLKWSKMTNEQRAKQVKKAHDKVRGSKHSTETKIKSAKSFYQNALRIGLFEKEIADILKCYFHGVEQQFPVDIYNVDIAIPSRSIAIEIQTNNASSLTTELCQQRIKKLADSGFFIIYVVCNTKFRINTFNIFMVTKKIISLITFSSLDKSVFGKYVMIGGDGYDFPSNRYDFNHVTRIKEPLG